MISFIHCGDIHLGFNQYNSEERFHDFHRSFSYIVDFAIEQRVDYLLLTGDFFNKRSINPKTLSQALWELTRLKDKKIQVIAIEGNHDKAPYGEGESWMRFLNEQGYLCLLSPRFAEGSFILAPWEKEMGGSLLSLPGIRFVGLGYQGSMTGRRITELAEQLEPSEEPTVLLLHSAVDMLMHLGGIAHADLAPLKDRVDYVAMGHIHHRYELEDWVFNPGSPESWDVGEGGKEKGFYHVVLAEGEKKVTFIPSVRRPVYSCAVQVSGCEELEEVYARCDGELAMLPVEKGINPILRIILKGSLPFSPLAIDTRLLEEKARAGLGCLVVEVVNDTVLWGDRETLTDSPAGVNREELEREVLRQLFVQRGDLNPWVQELVDLSRSVKELIHQEAEDESIASLVGSLAKKIVAEEMAKGDGEEQQDEVAAAGEPGEGGGAPQ